MADRTKRARPRIYVPTLQDKVAYWICGFANGGVETCVCQKTRGRCCEGAERIAKNVVSIVRDHDQEVGRG